jgi:hypothetical protein
VLCAKEDNATGRHSKQNSQKPTIDSNILKVI